MIEEKIKIIERISQIMESEKSKLYIRAQKEIELLKKTADEHSGTKTR